jgi:hypothetical protein
MVYEYTEGLAFLQYFYRFSIFVPPLLSNGVVGQKIGGINLVSLNFYDQRELLIAEAIP